MRINGEWLLCEDGVVRPVIRGEILASDGSWQRAEFLVDIGADRTVFSAPILSALRLQPRITEERIGGLVGRDITNLFAVIVDQPGNVICLLGQRHRYVIVQS